MSNDGNEASWFTLKAYSLQSEGRGTRLRCFRGLARRQRSYPFIGFNELCLEQEKLTQSRRDAENFLRNENRSKIKGNVASDQLSCTIFAFHIAGEVVCINFLKHAMEVLSRKMSK